MPPPTPIRFSVRSEWATATAHDDTAGLGHSPHPIAQDPGRQPDLPAAPHEGTGPERQSAPQIDPQAAPRADAPVSQRGSTAGHPAAAIHEQVLGVVASRICRTDRGERADCCLSMLCDALVASETEFDRTLAQVRSQHGLGDEEIVDCYIPAMACQLGTDWAENRRSFAEVTIGTARLIAAVRDLGRRWAADAVADWRAPAMLMVVPETEQHRLGAMIAASRFRRLGVSVQMLLGAGDDEVLQTARNGAFEMISFSLATLERVEQTRRLIQMLRDRVSPLPPLIVGGAIGANADVLKTQLGADHVVSDPEQALRLCGVSVRRREKSGSSRLPA